MVFPQRLLFFPKHHSSLMERLSLDKEPRVVGGRAGDREGASLTVAVEASNAGFADPAGLVFDARGDERAA